MTSTKRQESSVEKDNADNEDEFAFQVELTIETDRILKVLDRTIEKLELVMCLPFFLEDNGDLLKKFLPADEFAHAMFSFDRYMHSKENIFDDAPESIHSELQKDIFVIRNNILRHRKGYEPEPSVQEEEELEKDTKPCIVPVTEGRCDADICRALQLMYIKPRIMMFLNQHLLPKMSEAGSIFIDYMKYLRGCIAKRLAVSPRQEVADELNLRLTWIRNIKTQAAMKVLLEKLEIQRNEGNAQLAQKDIAIKTDEELIEKMKKCSKDDIKKRINESEKNMINDWRDSESRQEILQAQRNENDARYQKLLSENLRNEKSLKAKKIKVESQLLTVLGKYDADIGDLQNELDEINDGFNEEKRQMKDLQERFDIQEVEYIRLMAQKAEEERIEHERRVAFFTQTRAVRILQRYWRKYLRKKRRRKGKKKKK